MNKFLIKANSHHTWGLHRFGITFKNKIAFRAKFSNDCLYDLKNVNNYDINKLFGFSTTLWHHNQSARVGWRRHDDTSIEVLTYSYNNHKRIDETLLGIVKPDQEFTCTIEDTESHYVYTYNDGDKFNKVSDPKLSDKVWFKYLLFPYFGGDQKAPHDMTIYLKRIKI
jgi:hypothetical protein